MRLWTVWWGTGGCASYSPALCDCYFIYQGQAHSISNVYIYILLYCSCTTRYSGLTSIADRRRRLSGWLAVYMRRTQYTSRDTVCGGWKLDLLYVSKRRINILEGDREHKEAWNLIECKTPWNSVPWIWLSTFSFKAWIDRSWSAKG